MPKPTIVDLPHDLVEEAVRLWEATGLTRPWNDPRADLARALTGPSSTVLAALTLDQPPDAPGSLVGTVMVGYDGHRGWVYYLAVDPARQGQGLGSSLMAAAEEWLRTRGVPKVQLMVRATNTALVSFYGRLGYADQDCLVLGKFFDESVRRR